MQLAGDLERQPAERRKAERRQPESQSIQLDSVAVATVGLDADTVAVVRQVIGDQKWIFAGEFAEFDRVIADPRIAGHGQARESLVWIIDFDKDEELAAQAASALQGLPQGHIASIALSAHASPALILRAMRSGCSEYLEKPRLAEQLVDSVARQRARWTTSANSRKERSGTVLAFVGVRGGAGATTLAVHIATFLSKLFAKKTLIVDHHRHLGHVALFLGLDSPSYSFFEVVKNVERLDNELLASFIAHHSSGVDVLSSPANFEDSWDGNQQFLERALKFLAGAYDFVIIDCASGLDEEALSALVCCDEVYLVATQDLPALRDLSRYMERLTDCDVPAHKVKVVLNRYSSDRGVTTEQIESAIRRPVLIRVPNSAAELNRSVDMGAPISPEKKSDFVAQMKKWTSSLVPVAAGATEPRRKFSFWS